MSESDRERHLLARFVEIEAELVRLGLGQFNYDSSGTRATLLCEQANIISELCAEHGTNVSGGRFGNPAP